MTDTTHSPLDPLDHTATIDRLLADHLLARRFIGLVLEQRRLQDDGTMVAVQEDAVGVQGIASDHYFDAAAALDDQIDAVLAQTVPPVPDAEADPEPRNPERLTPARRRVLEAVAWGDVLRRTSAPGKVSWSFYGADGMQLRGANPNVVEPLVADGWLIATTSRTSAARTNYTTTEYRCATGVAKYLAEDW